MPVCFCCPSSAFCPPMIPACRRRSRRSRASLSEGGLIRRTKARADGPNEGVFLACSCWMADCLNMHGPPGRSRGAIRACFGGSQRPRAAFGGIQRSRKSAGGQLPTGTDASSSCQYRAGLVRTNSSTRRRLSLSDTAIGYSHGVGRPLRPDRHWQRTWGCLVGPSLGADRKTDPDAGTGRLFAALARKLGCQDGFRRRRYQASETWHGKKGETFHPGLHYYVGGNSKVYGAALFRLREQDFGELQHADGTSPAWPLGYDVFEPYYCEAEALFHVHGARGEDPNGAPVQQALRLPTSHA